MPPIPPKGIIVAVETERCSTKAISKKEGLDGAPGAYLAIRDNVVGVLSPEKH